MKPILKFATYIFLSGMIVFISCKKEMVQTTPLPPPPVPGNHSPIANAGADGTVTLPTNFIKLDGSGSTDADNNIISYAWTKISGPSGYTTSGFTIGDANAVKTQVTNLIQGVYLFELKVTDAGGLSSRDTVMITVNSNPANSSHWTALGFLPANEFFFGANYWFNGSNFLMGIDNKVFAVSNKGNVWQYDPQTNTWFKKGIFPEQMDAPPLFFSINNKGYCMGNGHCWQYDPATNQWTRKNDFLDGGFPLVINNKVYLVGAPHVLVYDPSTDTYTQKNNFPNSTGVTGFVINGEGYCIAPDGKCWKYDAAIDSWQQKASLPPFIENMSGFALNNYGYVIGDLNGNAYNLNYPMKVWRYDPSLNVWKQDEDYPGYGAYEINAVSFNGIVYVGMGYNNADFNATDFLSFK